MIDSALHWHLISWISYPNLLSIFILTTLKIPLINKFFRLMRFGCNLTTVIVIVNYHSVFHTKTCTRWQLCFNCVALLGCVAHAKFTEIYKLFQTVHWLHSLWPYLLIITAGLFECSYSLSKYISSNFHWIFSLRLYNLCLLFHLYCLKLLGSLIWPWRYWSFLFWLTCFPRLYGRINTGTYLPRCTFSFSFSFSV